MSANNNRLFPAGNQSWDVLDDNRFSEDSSVEDVSDGSIWTLPHGFQVEFFDSCFVRSDGCALDADFAFFDGFGSLDGDFVVSLISVLHAEIEVLDLEIEERKNKFISDGFPDDSGHLITVKFSYGVVYLDLSTLHKI